MTSQVYLNPQNMQNDSLFIGWGGGVFTYFGGPGRPYRVGVGASPVWLPKPEPESAFRLSGPWAGA